jgi:hypothetical protein
MNVSAEPVELGYRNRAALPSCLCQRRRKLWTAIQRIRAFARLNLGENAGKLKAFSVSEAHQSIALALKAKP